MVLSTATPDKTAELTWEIARLFPAQGHWSEEEYLALDTNHLTEFSHGRTEVLPLPTFSHQRLVALLYLLLLGFIEERGLGVVMFAPLRIQLGQGKFREPDLVFMAAEHADRLGELFWQGADLVMEIVSPDDPERDKVTKRREYAQSGIPEYWIVDPTDASITVLTLQGQEYAPHGEFASGETALSVLLEGFKVDVGDVFSETSK
ncbi:MAG: Uma2 family endonuclease [Caldilineaceae bacterium SB0675_bin_29]|uniref:Uma2 family endonuclease n=1 Tax=Caldilineaceae bacterium SB0675_bin_29 TaxID=2605266 RepID=A0A6B1FX00_9CHLR|nr:Uma2 family endonuclease [Caldilineaceae bacterium SB0675_bin_29]